MCQKLLKSRSCTSKLYNFEAILNVAKERRKHFFHNCSVGLSPSRSKSVCFRQLKLNKYLESRTLLYFFVSRILQETNTAKHPLLLPNMRTLLNICGDEAFLSFETHCLLSCCFKYKTTVSPYHNIPQYTLLLTSLLDSPNRIIFRRIFKCV